MNDTVKPIGRKVIMEAGKIEIEILDFDIRVLVEEVSDIPAVRGIWPGDFQANYGNDAGLNRF